MIGQRLQTPRDTRRPRLDRRRLGRAAGSLLLGGLAARSLGPLPGPVWAAAARTDDAAAGAGGLLDLAPETPPMVGLADPSPLATFADIASQLKAVGIAPPEAAMPDTLEGWFPALRGLYLGDIVDAFLMGEESLRVHGWDGAQVDGLVGFGLREDRAVVIRGRFEPDAVRAAWEAAGYVPAADGPSDAGAPEVLTVLDEDIDLQDLLMIPPVMTFAALLPGGDGTDIAYAASMAGMDRVNARLQGETGPVTEQPGVPEMLAAAGGLVSGAIVPGTALRRTALDDAVDIALGSGGPADPDAVTTAVASAEAARAAMPPIELALLGITAGGPVPLQGTDAAAPEAEIRIVLRFAGEGAVATALPVLNERLATGVSELDGIPWTEIFGGWTVESVADHPALVLLRLAPNPDHRSASAPLWFGGTPGFLAW